MKTNRPNYPASKYSQIDINLFNKKESHKSAPAALETFSEKYFINSTIAEKRKQEAQLIFNRDIYPRNITKGCPAYKIMQKIIAKSTYIPKPPLYKQIFKAIFNFITFIF